jgi:hypothetical protein
MASSISTASPSFLIQRERVTSVIDSPTGGTFISKDATARGWYRWQQVRPRQPVQVQMGQIQSAFAASAAAGAVSAACSSSAAFFNAGNYRAYG